MKFHALYISVAIGLIYSSCQAAPILNNVADITSDRLDVPAGGVHVDSEGVHLSHDQDQGSLLQKRSPLLNNQGMDSISGGGGADGTGLLSELLTKRQGGDIGEGVYTVVDDFLLNTPLDDTLSIGEVFGGLKKKRDESNDDDGDDVFKHMPPPPAGATYGSGLAANRPDEALMDAMTKRGGEEEEEGDDNDDASSNGENTQDRPGPPPPGLTDEQLDDYFTKH